MPLVDPFVATDKKPLELIDPFAESKATSLVDPFESQPLTMPTQPSESSSVLRRAVGDPAVALAQGVVGLPQGIIGIPDLLTGGRIGKAIEDYTPIQFKETQGIIGKLYSPEAKLAQKRVSEAQGFVPKVIESVKNPSVIVSSALQSAPSMVGGGAMARGVVKLVPRVAPVVAAGIGEGLVTAGQNFEQTREESPTGTVSPAGSAVLAGSGALTGVIGVLGGKLASKLGIADIDVLAAGGVNVGVKQGIVRRILEGVVSEGLFEELPQSTQEQIAQNIAANRPIEEGVMDAAVQGMMAGGVMGGVANIPGGNKRTTPPPPLNVNPTVPPPTDQARIEELADKIQNDTATEADMAEIGRNAEAIDAALQRRLAELQAAEPAQRAPQPILDPEAVQHEAKQPEPVVEPLGYDIEAAQERYPDITPILADQRFIEYRRAGYNRAEAIQMVMADQQDDLQTPTQANTPAATQKPARIQQIPAVSEPAPTSPPEQAAKTEQTQVADVKAGTIAEQPKQEKTDAAITRVQPEDNQQERGGVPQGQDVQPNQGQVRQGQGGQAGGGGGVIEGTRERPAVGVEAQTGNVGTTPEVRAVLQEVLPANPATIVKEPWQMTRDEAKQHAINLAIRSESDKSLASQRDQALRDAEDHRQVVSSAIRNNKPVPESVLAEYPGFAQQLSAQRQTASKPTAIRVGSVDEKLNRESTPSSPEDTLADQLNAGTAVKPRYATFVRLNGKQVVSASDVDTLKGAGPYTSAEWGVKGKTGFVPLVEKPVSKQEALKAKSAAHVSIINGKETPAGDFKQAAQRVSGNLKSGEHGYVRAPDGKLFEIASDKLSAVPVKEMRTKAQRDIALLEDRISKAKYPNEREVLSNRLEELKGKVSKTTPEQDALKAKERERAVAPAPINQTVSTRKRSYPRYKQNTGATPLIDFIVDQGGIKAKNKMKHPSGDYDGAPSIGKMGGFARSIYGNAYAADEMAQVAHEKGLIPDAYPDTLWSRIESEIEAYRKTGNGLFVDDETRASISSAINAVQKTEIGPMEAGDLNDGDLYWNGQEWNLVSTQEDKVKVADGTTRVFGYSSQVDDVGGVVSKNDPLYDIVLEEFTKQESGRKSLTLDQQTPNDIERDRELAAKKKAKEKMLDEAAKPLIGKEIDTTGSLFQEIEPENPLFAAKTPDTAPSVTPRPLESGTPQVLRKRDESYKAWRDRQPLPKGAVDNITQKFRTRLIRDEKTGQESGVGLSDELYKSIVQDAEDMTALIAEEYQSKKNAGALWLDKMMRDPDWVAQLQERAWAERRNTAPGQPQYDSISKVLPEGEANERTGTIRKNRDNTTRKSHDGGAERVPVGDARLRYQRELDSAVAELRKNSGRSGGFESVKVSGDIGRRVPYMAVESAGRRINENSETGFQSIRTKGRDYFVTQARGAFERAIEASGNGSYGDQSEDLSDYFSEATIDESLYDNPQNKEYAARCMAHGFTVVYVNHPNDQVSGVTIWGKGAPSVVVISQHNIDKAQRHEFFHVLDHEGYPAVVKMKQDIDANGPLYQQYKDELSSILGVPVSDNDIRSEMAADSFADMFTVVSSPSATPSDSQGAAQSAKGETGPGLTRAEASLTPEERNFDRIEEVKEESNDLQLLREAMRNRYGNDAPVQALREVKPYGGQAQILESVAESFGERIVWYSEGSEWPYSAEGWSGRMAGREDANAVERGGRLSADESGNTSGVSSMPDMQKRRGVIYINVNAKSPLLTVFGHELTHRIGYEEPDLLNEFGRILVSELNQDVWNRKYATPYRESRTSEGTTPTRQDALHEFVADTIATHFEDADFWNRVGDKNPSLMRRIAGYISELIKRMAASLKVNLNAITNDFFRDAIRVKDAAANMIAKYGTDRAKLNNSQAGSMLNPMKVRFAKSEPKPLTPEERAKQEITDEERQEAVRKLHETARRIGSPLPVGVEASTALRESKIPGVDVLRQVAQVFGKRIVFLRGGKELSFEGDTIGDQPETIFLTEESEKPHLSILGHELIHTLRTDYPRLYDEFRDTMLPYLSRVPEFQGILSRFEGRQASEDHAIEELLANAAGVQFASSKFWDNLASKSPSLFNRVAQIVSEFVEKVLLRLNQRTYVMQRYITDIYKVRSAVSDAMKKYAEMVANEVPAAKSDRMNQAGKVSVMTPEERAMSAGAIAGAAMEGKRTADELRDTVRKERMKAGMPDVGPVTTKGAVKEGVKVGEQKGRTALAKLLEATENGKAAERIAQGRISVRQAVDQLVRADHEQAFKIRKAIVQWAREVLPPALRGKLLTPLIKKNISEADRDKALAKIDAIAEKAQKDNLTEALRKLFDKSASSPSVDVTYRSKIKEIMGGILLTKPTSATLAKARELYEYLESERATGGNTTINKRMAKLLRTLSGTPTSEMSVAQLEDLVSEVTRLDQIGRILQQSKILRDQQMKSADYADLRADTSALNLKSLKRKQIPGTEKETYLGALRELVNQTSDAMKKWYVYHQPMDAFFDLLDGAKHYAGANYRIFKARLDNAWGAFRSDMRPLEEEMSNKVKELGIKKNESLRIGIYAIDRQATGRDKLLNTFAGKDEAARERVNAQIDSIKLTDNEMKFYLWMREKLEAVKPAIAKVMRETYNAELTEEENYFPFITDWSLMESATDMYGLEQDDNGNWVRKNVTQGYTKERTGAGDQKVEVDALRAFHKHMNDVFYYIHAGPSIKYLQELASSDEYKKIAGDLGQRMVTQYLDTMARHGGMAGGHVLRWVDYLRNNVGVGTLGFRLSSMLIQPVSLIDGFGLIGSRWGFKGAINVTEPKWHKFIRDNMIEIRDRVGDDYAFENQNQLAKYGFMPLQKLDQLTAAAIASGAYEKSLHERGLTMDFSKPDRKALADAQLAVRRTQAAAPFKDQPLALSRGMTLGGSRTLARLLYQFQTFSMNKFSYMAHDGLYNSIKNKEWRRGLAILAWTQMAFAAEEAIRYGIRAASGGDDDDMDKEEAAKRMLYNNVAQIPMFGSILSALRYQSIPAPALNVAQDVAKGVASFTTGKTPETRNKGLIRAIGGIGTLAGVPGTSQASQTLRSNIRSPSQRIGEHIKDTLGYASTEYGISQAALRSFGEARREGIIPREMTLQQYRQRYRSAWSRAHPDEED